MSKYTPMISELREAWLSAEFEERDSTTSDDDLRAEFDRALAAHDAEVLRTAATELEETIDRLDPARPTDLSYINCTRIDVRLLRDLADRAEVRAGVQGSAKLSENSAGVVTEEPEWEYGTEYDIDANESVFTATHSEEMARKWVAESPHDTGLVRRRKAGPWVPVEQEGAER